MDFKEFETFARTYNVIPISKTLLADTLTPVSAYLRVRNNMKSSFLFESVEGGQQIARYSFIGCDPVLTLTCKRKKTKIFFKGEVKQSDENFFDIIQTLVGRYRQAPIPHLPRFSGGLVGFVGYDAVRFLEDIPSSVHDDTPIDDSIVVLFPSLIAFDHYKHHLMIVVNVLRDESVELRAQYSQALEQIKRLESMLQKPLESKSVFQLFSTPAQPATTAQQYIQSVQRAKQYIQDGDIFQVVLSQRFSRSFKGDPFHIYRALRTINPSPYLYYLDFDGLNVIGSSPEILVRMESDKAEVYPIAGTRPRGNTENEDKQFEEELLRDEKELAEHIMLVDLGRNDLGRVCEIGSVKVERLMNIVRYSHVMHIASQVTGKIASGNSCIDVLKATFPAGTVSGAPKIRAMEIIDELEPTRRGIYAGGVGYFDFSGNMDFCIAIRTMFTAQGKIYFQAGAGIVADSDPENEHRETINKARALVEALQMAERILP